MFKNKFLAPGVPNVPEGDNYLLILSMLEFTRSPRIPNLNIKANPTYLKDVVIVNQGVENEVWAFEALDLTHGSTRTLSPLWTPRESTRLSLDSAICLFSPGVSVESTFCESFACSCAANTLVLALA